LRESTIGIIREAISKRLSPYDTAFLIISEIRSFENGGNGVKGTELKILRIKQGIKALDLAKQLGISPGRLSQIEGTKYGEVSEKWVERYIQSLNEIQPQKLV